MLKKAFTAAVLLMFAQALSQAQNAQTMITGRSDLKAVYEISEINAQRTDLVAENRFPGVGNIEVGGYFFHYELGNLNFDAVGVTARYGLWETLAVGASVPFIIDSKYQGKTRRGFGDVALGAELLAFQDIFRYPYIIPHAEVSLPTGDDDKGLGLGETLINFGVSVGTKIYDQLSFIVDASYTFNGAAQFVDSDDNVYMGSAAIIWDISDRFSVLAEGRIYEKADGLDDNPSEYRGGLVYKTSRSTQVAVYGGKVDGGNGFEYDQAAVRVSLQF